MRFLFRFHMVLSAVEALDSKQDSSMSRFLKNICLLTFCSLTALSVNADTVTYTFESPQFSAGETTPLLNRSPNIGPASFQLGEFRLIRLQRYLKFAY